MDDLEDDPTNAQESCEARDRMLENEMRSLRVRGFHEGFDEGRQSTIQGAFDANYKLTFEENFILSTLKGVAQALKSSQNLNRRPTSVNLSTSSSSSPPPDSSVSSLKRSSDIYAGTGGSSSTIISADTSISSSSSSLSRSSTGGGNVCGVLGMGSNINVNISSDQLSTLESMRFNCAREIESIKEDLIKICRENRLEILAHYVSQIG